MRVGGTDDFAKQHERRLCQGVFLEDGVERHVLAVVSEFTAFDVEGRRAEFTCFGLHLIRGDKDELSLRVNELFDEPRTRNAVHFHFLARNPFHSWESWQYASRELKNRLTLCS